jgi:hypothetical protein
VVVYLRPLKQRNEGKVEEFRPRKTSSIAQRALESTADAALGSLRLQSAEI